MRRILFLLCVLLSACFNPDNHASEESRNLTLQFMKSANIDVHSALCRVSAEDMDTIEAALTVTPTMISGQINHVPYGEHRLFEIFCYNSNQILNYYGYSLADISDAAPVTNITLYPQQQYADVTIIGHFSSDEAETEEKIVFTADYSGTYDVYLMDKDGTNIRQLTDSDYNDNCPQLSPDRKKVVFQRGGLDIGHQGFIVDLESGDIEMLPLQDYHPHQLKWHPDGNKMLFWTDEGMTHDIYEYDLNSGDVTLLVHSHGVSSRVPAYTPDGEHILYNSNISGIYRAYLADADGSNPVLLNPDVYGEERNPLMHPLDSNLVVFNGRYTTSQWGFYFTDRSSGEIHEVISTPGVDENAPVWSNNGDAFIYEHWDGVNRGIYVVNADGTGMQALLDTQNNERYPHWR